MVLLKEFYGCLGDIDFHIEITSIYEKRGWGKNRSRFGDSSFRRRGVSISLKITSFA